jgi:hypothetical protein
MWDLIYSFRDAHRKTVAIESRLALCRGRAHVLACSPQEQASIQFKAMAMKSLECVDRMVTNGQQAADETSLLFAQECAYQEIIILGEMFKVFITVSQLQTQSSQYSATFTVLDTFATGWRSITFVSANWCYKQVSSHIFSFVFICLY